MSNCKSYDEISIIIIQVYSFQNQKEAKES